MSCTSGGDVTHRHNAVRDLVYELSRRERAGCLTDPAVVVELRRPADVLAKMARRSAVDAGANGAPAERVALDIKVINAIGRDHDGTGSRPDPQRAMSKYAAKAMAHHRTAEICAANNLRYAPLVFTAQGGA